MSDLRTRLVRRALETLQSPRVGGIIQRGPLLDVVVAGLTVQARVRVGLRRAGSTVASALGLATLDDLRALGDEVARRPPATGPAV
jgi:hypothetical protein